MLTDVGGSLDGGWDHSLERGSWGVQNRERELSTKKHSLFSSWLWIRGSQQFQALAGLTSPLQWLPLYHDDIQWTVSHSKPFSLKLALSKYFIRERRKIIKIVSTESFGPFLIRLLVFLSLAFEHLFVYSELSLVALRFENISSQSTAYYFRSLIVLFITAQCSEQSKHSSIDEKTNELWYTYPTESTQQLKE